MPGSPEPAVDSDVAAALASAALTLARRFHDGATMWCVSPAHPSHARHVAVEFVHPVIVGKRALPSVAVVNNQPAARLRTLARSGDVVVAIGAATDAALVDIMRRVPAWGLTSMWIGAGPRPPVGAADHVLWLTEDEHTTASASGRLILLYHLLWELTHVCFEHPGLLTEADDCDSGDACVTCSDEGRVGEVVDVRTAGDVTVRTAGGVEVVDATLAGGVRSGDLVLVHAGTVIAVTLEGQR